MSPYELRHRNGKDAGKKQQTTTSYNNPGRALVKAGIKNKRRNVQTKNYAKVSGNGELPATPIIRQPANTDNLQRSNAPSPPILPSRGAVEETWTPLPFTILASTGFAGELQSSPASSPSRPSARTRRGTPPPPPLSQTTFSPSRSTSPALLKLQTNTPSTSPLTSLSQIYSTIKAASFMPNGNPRKSARFSRRLRDELPHVGPDVGDSISVGGKDASLLVTERDSFGDSPSGEDRAQLQKVPYESQGLSLAVSDDVDMDDATDPSVDPGPNEQDMRSNDDEEYHYRQLSKYTTALGHPAPPRLPPAVMKRVAEDSEYRKLWFTELRDLSPQYEHLPDLAQRKWRQFGFRDEDDIELGDEDGDGGLGQDEREEKEDELGTLVETIKVLCGQYTEITSTLQREVLPDINEGRQRAQWYRRLTSQERAEFGRICTWMAVWNPETKGKWSTKEMWTGFPFRVKKKDGIWRELASDEERGSEDSDSDDDDPADASARSPVVSPSSSQSVSPEVRFLSVRPTARSPPPPQPVGPSRKYSEYGVAHQPRDVTLSSDEDEGDNLGARDKHKQRGVRGSPRGVTSRSSTSSSSSSADDDDTQDKPRHTIPLSRRPAYGAIRPPWSHTPDSDDASTSSGAATVGSDLGDPAPVDEGVPFARSPLSVLNNGARRHSTPVAASRAGETSDILTETDSNVQQASPLTVANGNMRVAAPAVEGSGVQANSSSDAANNSTGRHTVAALGRSKEPSRPSPPAYVHRPTGEKRGRNPWHPGFSRSQPELNPAPAKKRRIKHRDTSDSSDEEQRPLNIHPEPEHLTAVGIQQPEGSTSRAVPSVSFATTAGPSVRQENYPSSGSNAPIKASSSGTRPPSSSTPSKGNKENPASPVSGRAQASTIPSRPSTSSSPMPPPSTIPRRGKPLTRTPTPNPQALSRTPSPSPEAGSSKGRRQNTKHMTPIMDRSEGRKFLVPTDKLNEKLRQYQADTLASLATQTEENRRRIGLMDREQAAMRTDETARSFNPTVRRPTMTSFRHGFPLPASTCTSGRSKSPTLVRKGVATRRGPPLARQVPRDVNLDPRPEYLSGEVVPLTLAHLPEELRKKWLRGKPKTADKSMKSRKRKSDELQDEEDSFDVECMLEDAQSPPDTEAESTPSDILALEEQLREEAEAMAEAAICAGLMDPQDEVDAMLIAMIEDKVRDDKSGETATQPATFSMRTLPFWANPNDDSSSSDHEDIEMDVDMEVGTDSDTDVEDDANEPLPDTVKEEADPIASEGKGKGRADGQPSGSFKVQLE